MAWLIALALLLVLGVAAWWLGGRPGWPAAPAEVPSGARPSGAAPTASETGTVDWIADGDTLDIVLAAGKTRVRLLNIDTPELAHDGASAQCLSDETTTALKRLAPAGARVRVDSYGHDRYGRLLAGVYLTDGRLANAEIVRLGLAGPLVVGGQRDLLAPVEAAQAEAARAGVGLHGGASCSLPGRLAAARARLDRIPPSPGVLGAALQLPGAKAVAAEASAISTELHAGQRDALVQGLTADEFARADSAATTLKADADALVARLAAAR